MLRFLVAAIGLIATNWALGFSLKPEAKVAVDMGGDTIRSVTFSDGEVFEINAGQGPQFSLGVGGILVNTTASLLESNVAVGYKFTGPFSQTGRLLWQRFPVEGMVLYTFKRWGLRIGAGGSYHFANRVEGYDGFAGEYLEAREAFGGIAQLSYLIPDAALSLDLRVNYINYEIGGVVFSGNSVGLGISFLGDSGSYRVARGRELFSPQTPKFTGGFLGL